MHILAELQPFDPVAGARVTLRVCSANDSSITGLNNQKWWPAILERPSFGVRLFKGDFDGRPTISGGNLALTMLKLLELDANARRFLWQGAPVKLYAGNSGEAWPWQQVLEGTTLLQGRSGPKLKLSLKVDESPFDADVLTAKYLGNGGIEGPADLKDKFKPIIYGRCLNIEPVLIDQVNNVYQVSGYGAIQAITKVYERGSEFPASVGDYASYAALIAAVIPNGQYATCLAQGLFRLGAPSYGVITADVDGDKNGGVWRRKTGEICLRALAACSVSGAKIETASFTALDTAMSSLPNQGRVGIYITEQVKCIDLIADLCGSCNAQAGVSLLGKVFVTRPVISSPTLTLDVQKRQMPRVTQSEEGTVTEPYSYMEFGYARSWRVHTEDEIATYDVDPATQEALDILAAATGKVTYGGPLPSINDSSVDDLHVADDGLVYKRVSSTGILLDGKVIVLGGFRPVIAWTLASAQPIAVGIGYGLQAIDEAQAAADAALIAQTLANDAQATADGKIQTYYQATAPSGASEGDIWIDTDNGNNQYRRTSGSWVDVQDTGIGQAIADAAGAQATADGKVTTFIGETAPTAEAVGDLWLKESSGQLRRWSGISWGDPLADLTAVQQVVIVPPVPQIVYRDWQGNIKSGQYNRTLVPKVERGGVDIRDDNDVTYAISTTGSIVATVNNTTGSADKGKITATDGSSGSIILTVTVAAVSFPTFTIPFTNQDDNPPTTGGGSGNTGGSDSTLEDVTSASFATITQQDGGESVFLIDITSGQTLHGTAPLAYQKSGTNTTATALTGKWQYRLQGDPTWLDFTGSAITGSGAYWNDVDFAAETGDATVNQSKASLATGTYEVQLVAAKSNSAAGNLQIISGTATVSRS